MTSIALKEVQREQVQREAGRAREKVREREKRGWHMINQGYYYQVPDPHTCVVCLVFLFMSILNPPPPPPPRSSPYLIPLWIISFGYVRMYGLIGCPWMSM
jgi:hypothetical protein